MSDQPHLSKATCGKCGQVWSWPKRGPSLVTQGGCPTCSEEARKMMQEQNRLAALEAITRALDPSQRTQS